MPIQVVGTPVIQGGGGTPQGDPTGGLADTARLLFQVKQFKMEQEKQKMAEAQAVIQHAQWATSQGLLTPDMADAVDKAQKTLTKSFETLQKSTPLQQPARQNPQEIPNVGAAGPQFGAGAGPGGAQSAFQPSADAGRKAPGGAVESGSLGQRLMQRSQQTAQELNLTSEQHDMQQRMINDEFRKFQETGDISHLGRARMIAGDKMSDSELATMMGTPEGRDQAIRMLQGYRTPQQEAQLRATVFDSVSKSNKNLSPEEARQVTNSIVENNPVPSQIEAKAQTNDKLLKENEALQTYSQIYPSDVARKLAQAAANGVDPTSVIPGGAKTLKEMELGVRQGELGLEAQRNQIEAGRLKLEAAKFQDEQSKISIAMRRAPYDEAWSQLRDIATAAKAGIKIPQQLKDETLNKVAALSGLAPNEAYHWYKPWEDAYSPVVTDEDKKKNDTAAGGKQPSDGTQKPSLDYKGAGQALLNAPKEAVKTYTDLLRAGESKYLELLKKAAEAANLK